MSVKIKRSYQKPTENKKEEVKDTVKIEDYSEEIVKKLSKKSSK